jgi:invasion protein IalB
MPRMPRPVLALAGLIALANSADAATLQRRHGDWSTYKHEDAQQTICFALSQPKDIQPKGVSRGGIYFYISAWPREGVKAEVSARVGYPLKKGTPVTLVVGAESFLLFSTEDRAYVSNPADELRLIEAMKKGSRMVLTGQSERGTTTTDTYSLSGFAAALQQLTQGCQ